MILGMSVSTFTTLHVIISLIGIATGFIALVGMLTSDRIAGWTALFLISTVLTSVTGFFFPLVKVGPPHIFGAISLVLLAAALLGIYAYKLAGPWRWIYVVTALVAQWFNVAVGIIQAFQKLPFLQPLAPTQSEPPFLIVQLVVLLVFVVLGWLAVRRFHPAAQPA
jgi:hypothetical protein